MMKREKSMKHTYGIALGLAVLLSTTAAIADGGLMHPFGAEKTNVLLSTEPKLDKEYGVLAFNPYHILQPAKADKSIPVYSVSSGRVYDIEETKENGFTVYVIHDDGGRSSYAFLDKEKLPKKGGQLNKGDIVGQTSVKFNNKLKYELVASNGYVIRHDFGKDRNRQNFVYTADDVGFAFYNPNPLGASPSSTGNAAPNASSPDAGNFYVTQQFATTNTTNTTMNDGQIDSTLCPPSVEYAMEAQAAVKLQTINRMRDLVMTEPASVKSLACHDSFVRDMATNVAKKGIFGQIINIFGATGTLNQNFGTSCEGGTKAGWNNVVSNGLDTPRYVNGQYNAHRNIMYPGMGGNSWYNPLNNPSALAPLYAPNLQSYMASFFLPGARAKNLNVDQNGNPMIDPTTGQAYPTFFYPLNPGWGSGQMAPMIKTTISGHPVTIPRNAYYP